MPAFVSNGPDIPEKLLFAHEEGRVVFFCGSGISIPAGLPDFRGLVNGLYEDLGVQKGAIHKAAFKAGRFDEAIGLLENAIVDGRSEVRTTVVRILTPGSINLSSTATHEALLTLARTRDNKLRLVTTNFDRLFEQAIEINNRPVKRFEAPLLPIPKTRWDGLVYLHGLLPQGSDDRNLNHLVLSSGDFGLAYLVERWAARFVSEVFKNFIVCFIGYSINDPVMRYMVDALSADHLLGESPPEMFAFASYSKGKEEECREEWRAKNVTPVLYREHNKHMLLHQTLHAWARTYDDHLYAKRNMIVQHAGTAPLTSSKAEFAVGRVLWALSDNLAAKQFSELEPVPPFEWIGPLTNEQFGAADSMRPEVSPGENPSDKSFSFINGPAPYKLAPWICVSDTTARHTEWDKITEYLAHWLARHLNDPRLLLWLVKQGGPLHPKFVRMVENVLEELEKLKRKKPEELARVLQAAPNAVPGAAMLTLWRLLLSGRVKTYFDGLALYTWSQRFARSGLTPSLRLELRELLSPRVVLSERLNFGFNNSGEKSNELKSPKGELVSDFVRVELALYCHPTHFHLGELKKNPDWQRTLPELLGDLSALVHDALDLMRECGEASDREDSSFISQPSISEHPQNKNRDDWTVLIELTRDSWLATLKTDPQRAKRVAEDWWHVPYPLFKRLAFFAAANSDIISTCQALDWILADNSWWLWSVQTKREVMRLLVSLAPTLDLTGLARLEQAILQGPPRRMFCDGIDDSEWARMVDGSIRLRLTILEANGAALGNAARFKQKELSSRYPQWENTHDERSEFSIWIESGSHYDEFMKTPSRRRELMAWLTEHPKPGAWVEDDWRKRCRDDFSTTAGALLALVRRGEWPEERWREALRAWRDEKVIKLSWRHMARVIESFPKGLFVNLASEIGEWLQAQAQRFVGQVEDFFFLVDRLLVMEYPDTKDGDLDPAYHAIIHPIGRASDALLRLWYRQEPKEEHGLAVEFSDRFTALCSTEVNLLRHGRVCLATHAISLFRVDEQWTKTHLLPLFDWERSEAEAQAAWAGFLSSGNVYLSILAEIKQPFLDTAGHFPHLGKKGCQYAAYLTVVALDPGDVFSQRELAKATSALPSEGLEESARTLIRALEGSGEQCAEYWRNRLQPYLKAVWPKDKHVRTPVISEYFARLCIDAGDAFPEAMRVLRGWLSPVKYSGFLVDLMAQAGLCSRFPNEALELLDAIIDNDGPVSKESLRNCLNAIRTANETLSRDRRFLRLERKLLES